MAGRHSTTSRSSIPFSPIIIIVSLLAILSLLFLFSSSSSSRCIIPNPNPIPNPNLSPPEYSFVSSLETFLSSPRSLHHNNLPTDLPVSPEDLDRRISEREPAVPDLAVVRVYVYDMPAKFTYDLLRLFLSTYRETTNLTSNGSPVHRLIEQHSIDYWLWADLIAPESERLLRNVIRVHRQEDADLFYIPFFTTISFFLLEKQQCKALYRVCAPN